MTCSNKGAIASFGSEIDLELLPVAIPSHATRIGERAFHHCEVAKVFIPNLTILNSVTYIGASVSGLPIFSNLDHHGFSNLYVGLAPLRIAYRW